MAKKQRASFNPENLSTSTGLLDDAKVGFTESRFGMFDYGGKSPEAPAFISKLVDMEDESENEQVWTVGGTPQDWEIGDDGESLVPISKKADKGININSNFGQLLVSLGNNGFPAETLDDMDASDFDGMEAHVIRVESKSNVKDDTGNKKSNETVIVDEIITLPGDIKAEETDKDEEKEEEESADEAAKKFVNDVLKEEGEVTKKDLPKKAFDMLKDEDDKTAILELIFDDKFLKANWKLKGGVITAK